MFVGTTGGERKKRIPFPELKALVFSLSCSVPGMAVDNGPCRSHSSIFSLA